MIFVNLPVTDLGASRAFYTALGFRVNEAFSDDQVAAIVVSETIVLMLLTRDRFADFVTGRSATRATARRRPASVPSRRPRWTAW